MNMLIIEEKEKENTNPKTKGTQYQWIVIERLFYFLAYYKKLCD